MSIYNTPKTPIRRNISLSRSSKRKENLSSYVTTAFSNAKNTLTSSPMLKKERIREAHLRNDIKRHKQQVQRRSKSSLGFSPTHVPSAAVERYEAECLARLRFSSPESKWELYRNVLLRFGQEFSRLSPLFDRIRESVETLLEHKNTQLFSVEKQIANSVDAQRTLTATIDNALFLSKDRQDKLKSDHEQIEESKLELEKKLSVCYARIQELEENIMIERKQSKAQRIEIESLKLLLSDEKKKFSESMINNAEERRNFKKKNREQIDLLNNLRNELLETKTKMKKESERFEEEKDHSNNDILLLQNEIEYLRDFKLNSESVYDRLMEKLINAEGKTSIVEENLTKLRARHDEATEKLEVSTPRYDFEGKLRGDITLISNVIMNQRVRKGQDKSFEGMAEMWIEAELNQKKKSSNDFIRLVLEEIDMLRSKNAMLEEENEQLKSEISENSRKNRNRITGKK
ncbi:hypothetical protein PCE1_002896 [Barthelona sp. PCE]